MNTAATREWARAAVRGGLLSPEALYDEVRAVIAADHPSLDAARTAREWIAVETGAWRADAATWPATTDFDCLQVALADVEERGIVVLQGCADHWAARDALQAQPAARGVAWFTLADVWHAVDEPMLEINLWHADGGNAALGDPLLEQVLAILRSHSLTAAFDEGRIEVAMRWERRPARHQTS